MINGMTGDTSGGVCLIKEYSYYTYSQGTCPCADIVSTGLTTTYLPMGIYVIPYVNTNANYTINNQDDSIFLQVDSFSGFTESYILDLVTTGYTGNTQNNGKIYEDRVIYDLETNNYYYFENDINSINCTSNTDSLWSIIDNNNGGILFTGVGDYFYTELNNCGTPTGNKYVYLSDINPSSATYGQTQTILKCPTS